MTQKTAHATDITTDIMSHPGVHQENPTDLQRWEMANALQTTLDIKQLLEMFSRMILPIFNHSGFKYSNHLADINITGGIHAHHSFSCKLIIEKEILGEMQLMRRKRFNDQEIRRIEDILCCLVYPLRNTLMYREALQSAHTDPLTHVNNRIAMEDCIQREWELAHRQSTPLSLMLLDIDYFKSINDNYGHGFGDTVLKAVAQKIKATVRASDMVFRYGGEEFVVVLSLSLIHI